MSKQITLDDSVNVFGDELLPCSLDPLTGFFRDGCCNTCEQDVGSHTICVEVNDQFLAFSKSVGNDLSTPQPGGTFQGLKSGDRWCLCAARWLQAYQDGAAPRIFLNSTHINALEIVPIELLQEFAVTVN